MDFVIEAESQEFPSVVQGVSPSLFLRQKLVKGSYDDKMKRVARFCIDSNVSTRYD